MKKTFILLAVLVITLRIYSIPATPFPIIITQPDGSQITIRLHGDEYFNYKTTLDGYLLLTDDVGILNYAQVDTNGKLTNTTIKASEIQKRTNSEKKFIQTLNSKPDFSKLIESRRAFRTKSMISASNPQKAYPLTGTPKSLVILVNFTDKSFVVPTPQTSFQNLVTQNGYSANGGTGSAKDYFFAASNSKFAPDFVVAGPINLPQNMLYYGGNDKNGNDKNPAQMVLDACAALAATGFDFAPYDTDNNGVIDNVFIYYAGYNEAEGGSPNTIWPHRSSITNAGLTSGKYSGKTVDDYSCTSELQGASGSNMCGIGTFCHEFGHVLGLDDMYNTNGDNSYITLETFDIMDYGPYLNSGRTPPSYSAYERFFLNWLVPTELKTATDISLSSITSSNQAYLISQTGNHNLNGQNPNPVEFFLLENRQNTGWDKYFGMDIKTNSPPAHGLYITHIFYNATDWANNSPNNTKNAMGVDVVRADGIATTATLAGDLFPGTTNVTTFNPVLRDNTKLSKNISTIKEINTLVTFHYGATIAIPIANEANDIKLTGFIANWSAVPKAIGYYLSVYTKVNGIEVYNLQNKWTTSISDTLTNLLPGTQYFYKVKASEININYENITDFSNTISVSTLPYPFTTKLLAKVESSGDVTVYLPTVKNPLYVYNLLGQNIRTIIPLGSIVNITDLPKNQVYILKSGNLISKIVK